MGAEYKDKTFYERVMMRHAEMVEDRKNWDSQREVIVEYYRPDITIYSAKSSSETGKFLHEDLVEGTGSWSAAVMARGFQGSMVGPTLQWRQSQMKQMRFRGNDSLNAWLQRGDDYMLEVYRQSNFYEIIGPDVLDGITVGSPVMLIEEDEATGKIICKLPHYKENYLKRDWFGNDIAYHRLFEVNPMNAMMEFGIDNLPPDTQQKLRSGDHKTKDKYLMVVYHEDDPIFKDLKNPELDRPGKSNLLYTPKRVPGRPWQMYYLPYTCTDERYKGALPHGVPAYWHKPFAAWHYFRNPHETYARTPAWSAIYDEKAGQAAWTALYDVAEYSARPPMIALQEAKRRTKAVPGKFSWAMSDNEWDRAPKPLITGIKYPDTTNFVDRIDANRKRHFHIDLFRMLDEYHREHKQPPTAYEVAQMLAEKNVQIGPAIESFDRGLLTPVDERFMEIEIRSGRFWNQTDPPDEIYETDGETIPQFTGPLAQAQKLSVVMRRVTDNLSMVAPIFELWPDARDKINAGILVERILEEGGFFQDAIVPQEKFEKIQEDKNAMRQRQLQLEQMSMMADAVPKLQGATQSGSPMKILESAA